MTGEHIWTHHTYVKYNFHSCGRTWYGVTLVVYSHISIGKWCQIFILKFVWMSIKCSKGVYTRSMYYYQPHSKHLRGWLMQWQTPRHVSEQVSGSSLMVFEELRHVWPNNSLPAILPVKSLILEIRRDKKLKPCFSPKHNEITFYNAIRVKGFFSLLSWLPEAECWQFEEICILTHYMGFASRADFLLGKKYEHASWTLCHHNLATEKSAVC